MQKIRPPEGAWLESAFVGYVTCAWLVHDGHPPDQYDAVDDLEDETAEKIRKLVSKFATEHAEVVAQFDIYRGDQGAELFGHDLFLTHNGHGTGFWNRGLGAVGEALAAAAKRLGESELYVGDDGRLHAS